MAFDVHEIKNAKDLPARISLRSRKMGVACYLSIRADALKAISGNDKSAYDVLIGSGEDAGKLRLHVSAKGRFKPRKLRNGMLIFPLGQVASFPDREIDKQYCDARTVDQTTVEIMLPDWSAIAEDDDAEDGDDQPTQRAAGGGAPKTLPPVAPAKRSSPAISKNGITLDLTIGEENISFGNKVADITTRQAAVLSALLRAMPSNVGREWLIANVLTDIAQHMRAPALDMVFGDLAKALPGIGLELKVTKGVGAALAIVGKK